MSGAGNGRQVSRGVQAALKNAPSGRAARGPDAAGLPAFAQVGRAEIAIVGAGEYRALRALRDAVTAGGTAALAYVRPGRRRLCRLDKDREVRDFILERIASEDVDRVRQAAVAMFGRARVPSRTTVWTFVRRHRHMERGYV